MNFYQTHVNRHSNLHVNFEPIITNQLKIEGFVGKTISRLKRDSIFKLIRLHNNIYVDHTLIDNLDVSFRFLLVYLLLQRKIRLKKKLNFALKTTFNVITQTISNIFYGIGAAEREVYDLFGVSFKNHPDLRRVVSDYGFKGNPLKKDFPLTGTVEIFFSIIKKILIFRVIKFTQEIRIFHREAPWNDFIEDFFTSPKSEQEDDSEMIPIILAFCLISGIFNLDWTSKNSTKGIWKPNWNSIQPKMEKPVLSPNKKTGHTVLDYYTQHQKQLYKEEIKGLYDKKNILAHRVGVLEAREDILTTNVNNLGNREGILTINVDNLENREGTLLLNVGKLENREGILLLNVDKLENQESILTQEVQYLIEEKNILGPIASIYDEKKILLNDITSMRTENNRLSTLCIDANDYLSDIRVNSDKLTFYSKILSCLELRSSEEIPGNNQTNFPKLSQALSFYRKKKLSAAEFMDWAAGKLKITPQELSSYLHVTKHGTDIPSSESADNLISFLKASEVLIKDRQTRLPAVFHKKYMANKPRLDDLLSPETQEVLDKFLDYLQSLM